MLLGLVREGEGVAAQVLVSLGADLSRVRQQVIQLLSGYQAAGPEKPPSLRCGRCGASLSESVRHGTIKAPLGLGAMEDTVLGGVVLYCGDCGAVIGPLVSPTAATLIPPLAATVYLRPAPSGSAEPLRRFPQELRAPVRLEAVPDEARVELSYRDNDDIDGTAGGKTVRVVGQLGPRGGPVRGTWGGVAVRWRVADKLGTPAGRVPGIMWGHVGDDPVKLEGSFLLGPRYLLEEADISGDLGGHNLGPS